MGNRNFIGRYKKWTCGITYSTTSYTNDKPFWYFTCSKGGSHYNSLWNDLKYSSKEETHDACIEYIDTQEKIS